MCIERAAARATPAPDAFERAANRGSNASGGIETPAPVGDSGSGLELPSLDAPAAVAVGGGLAGAGLLIAAAMFTARRNRIRPL